MKRLLIFLLSLLLVSLSPAAVLELSINGATNGTNNDMATTLAPLGTATIAVSAINGAAKINWDITVGNGNDQASGPGSFGVGTLHMPPSPNGAMVDYTSSYGYSYVSFLMAVDVSLGEVGVYWDSQFHCDGQGLVTITLLDAGTGLSIDTITVTQGEIPEPMTIGLLGLGGLFLRRRIKK